ncbi:PREDICTED: uncharacterized protein LOC104611636 [Nelumbo nucifera]|uniref:Uncharacterized protein LOC104611636 n=2 Tax=Nelumbo nucifera TaxID=4432 RepID=A0A1U8B7Q9_NELNU|nr:PREDICTED: uncharacterized protein LOC104611636 [Nelumbo nucifera]DAD21348.1 TPA_asm: hypothetical protein HUJ06_022811 [Nelumbo nucifera]
MKTFGSWVLVTLAGIALMFFAFTSSSVYGKVSPSHGDTMMVFSSYRKLKDENYSPSKRKNLGNLNLEDYGHLDPPPSSSSRETIKSGPIEYGTPVIPYIPKRAPPSPPKDNMSP